MIKPNPDVLADILETTVRAERLFLRAQFDADSKEEIEWAQNGLRHARGLKKIVGELPSRLGATAPALTA